MLSLLHLCLSLNMSNPSEVSLITYVCDTSPSFLIFAITFTPIIHPSLFFLASFARGVFLEDATLPCNSLYSRGVLLLQLETEQKSNFATAARLRDRLDQLAARLQVSAEEIQQFNTKYTGFRPKVIQVVRTLLKVSISNPHGHQQNLSQELQFLNRGGTIPSLSAIAILVRINIFF